MSGPRPKNAIRPTRPTAPCGSSRRLCRPARGALVIPLGLVAVALIPGCQVYDASLIQAARPTGPQFPARPDASAEGPDGAPLTFAVRDPVLDQSENDAWRTIGLNLDGLFTDDLSNPDVECVTANGQIAFDGEDGIDNVMGARFFPLVTLAEAAATLEGDARLAMMEGLGTPIITISGYNHEANDPRVEVGIATAVAGTSAEFEDVAFDVGDPSSLLLSGTTLPAPAPLWDGHDHWFVRDDGFLLGDIDEPFAADVNAYVADYELVVRLPDRVSVLVQTNTVSIDVRLSDAVAIITLSPDLGTLLDVVIGGRMATRDMLAIGESVGICAGTSTFDLLSRAVDGYADLLSVGGGSAGVDSICDALSIGIRFEGGVAAGAAPRSTASPPLPVLCP